MQNILAMGTTIVMLIFTTDKLFIANVGDSRAYRIKSDRIIQLTDDHTLVNELLKAGLIEPDQVENHPVAHMLTRSLGPTAVVEVDCFLDSPGPETEDHYLLCSDGLYNLVDDYEIGDLVNKSSLKAAVSGLISLANERGGTDNITISLIRVKHADPSGLEVEYEGYQPEENVYEERALIPIYFPKQDTPTGEVSFENVFIGRQDRSQNGVPQSSFNKYTWQTLITLMVLITVYLGLSIVSPTNSVTNIVQDPLPNESTQPPVVDIDINDIETSFIDNDAKRNYLEKINLINNKYLDALEKPENLQLLLDSEELLSEEFDNFSELQKQQAIDLNNLNKQLSVWYNRKQKLESVGAMQLSGELTEVSEKIEKKQQVFEEVSWLYLQKVEESRDNPEDLELKATVADLLKQRKSAIKDLELGVYAVIQEQIDIVNQKISETISKISETTHNMNILSKELDVITEIHRLKEDDLTAFQNKLLKEINQNQEELSVLEDTDNQ